MLISVVSLALLAPFLAIFFLVSKRETGSGLFTQARVGRGEKLFYLIKFRTLPLACPNMPTDKLEMGPPGRGTQFLRKSKIDELPQLINVLRGEMSLIGPRPCLPEQQVLIELRRKHDLYELRPGISGYAQLKGVDMSNPQKLASIEKEAYSDFTLGGYLWLIKLSLWKAPVFRKL